MQSKEDFGYKFELLDNFKNSLSDEHLKKYDDKVRLEKFWLHKLRNSQNLIKNLILIIIHGLRIRYLFPMMNWLIN